MNTWPGRPPSEPKSEPITGATPIQERQSEQLMPQNMWEHSLEKRSRDHLQLSMFSQQPFQNLRPATAEEKADLVT